MKKQLLEKIGIGCRISRLKAMDTLEAASLKMGVSPSNLSKFERGENDSIYLCYLYEKTYGFKLKEVDAE